MPIKYTNCKSVRRRRPPRAAPALKLWLTFTLRANRQEDLQKSKETFREREADQRVSGREQSVARPFGGGATTLGSNSDLCACSDSSSLVLTASAASVKSGELSSPSPSSGKQQKSLAQALILVVLTLSFLRRYRKAARTLLTMDA